jgi:hypothetical protein
MRNMALLIGMFSVACAVDHVVVATLDGSGGTNGTNDRGDAGSSGSVPSAAGNVSSGGSHSGGGTDRIILASGGTNVDVRIGEDAGAASYLMCSCLGERQAELCGSDGLTYPGSCDDGGTCLPPAIACFHACPCLEDESGAVKVTSWFPETCAATAGCSDFTCLAFSNVTVDQPNCTATAP